MASPAQALADLFSKARLSLSTPASPVAARSVVYFDEILDVHIVLSLPSHPLLAPARSEHGAVSTSYELPLASLPSQARLTSDGVPPYLAALLACLHVNLATDYVADAAAESAAASKSTNPYEPLATVQLGFEHLQLLPSHAAQTVPGQPAHAAVRAFSNSWAGNQPPKPHRTLRDAPSSSSSSSAASSSHRANLSCDASGWRVQWHCRVPVNFIATPFAPLLALTAALTLRLDPALLDHHLSSPASRAFVRSGFAHSLLAPLHEGPVYPDESPLQSQARATASAALGLDGPSGLGSFLAHLPKEVVGGNTSVVTPRSGALALAAIHRRRNEALSPIAAEPNQPASMAGERSDSNGDLAALGAKTQHGSTPASQAAGEARPVREDGGPSGLHIYKRSTRAVLPLKTGLNVRMRTLLTPHDPQLGRQAGSREAPIELQTRQLVLCVELENPLESPCDFVVHQLVVRLEQTPGQANDALQVEARPLHPLATTLPIQLTPGSQHNLLFYVSVDPHTRGQMGVSTVGATRNVNITISGRPAGGEGEAEFDSQWNCTLELGAVLADAVKKASIANAGRPARVERPLQARVAGNAQYSASALRASRLGHASVQMAAPLQSTGSNAVEDLRTPRPGQLGMGFPPQRAFAHRHLSTASNPPSVQEAAQASQRHALHAGGFLEAAKARAAKRLSRPPVEAGRHEAVAALVRPWTASSSGSGEASQGLVVLSSIRRRSQGETSASHVSYHSSLGQDGIARPSVSTGAKELHPQTGAHPSRIESRGLQFQSGEVVVLDLSMLLTAPLAVDSATGIADISLDWMPPPTLSVEESRPQRESIDAAGVPRLRLMDAESARTKSALIGARAESINGLVPLHDHLVLPDTVRPGQTASVSLSLSCLAPGYHVLPPLKLSFDLAAPGEPAPLRHVVLLDGLGSVHITPPAVL